MSVTALNQIHSQQISGQDGYHRTYRSLYQAITDDVTDSAVDVVLDTQPAGSLHLPQIGDYYLWQNSYDLAAIVIGEPDIQLRDVNKSRKVWDVLVTHTTQPLRRTSSSRMENPLDEPWRVRLLGDEWTEEATIDAQTGQPLTNSSKQALTGKVVEVYKSRSRWQLTKNRANSDQDLIDYSRGHVNSQTVTIRGRVYGRVECTGHGCSCFGWSSARNLPIHTAARTGDLSLASTPTRTRLTLSIQTSGRNTTSARKHTIRRITQISSIHIQSEWLTLRACFSMVAEEKSSRFF